MRRNIIKKISGWALPLAACALIAIAAVKASETNRNPEFNIDRTPIERNESVSLSYSSVVKKVRPSIVSISTSKTVQAQNIFGDGISPFGDELFRRFFGDRGSPQQRAPQKRTGLGSGVIVSENGYILTNNHVVADSDEIKVTLSEGDKEFDAKIVGSDPRSDIAVLKIDAKDLPVATLGDSDLVEDGDVVLAFGNPFGVGQTVTLGIVSATGRSNLGIEEYENFIQTDAAINPGNSGGALTDALGRVIGINTAIYTRSGGYQGIGFAIPINMAEDIMKQIISSGKVSRGYLGVTLQRLTDDLVEGFNLKDKTGALVTEVQEGSAAEKAGIKVGDVIIAINGKEAKDNATLGLLVAGLAPGEVATVRVIRDAQEQDISVTLDEWPEGAHRFDGSSRPGPSSESVINGVSLREVTPELRKEMQIPDKITGVLVSEVDPESSAGKNGIKAGDIIMECNGTNTRTIAELRSSMQATESRARLLVYSHSRNVTRFVILRK